MFRYIKSKYFKKGKFRDNKIKRKIDKILLTLKIFFKKKIKDKWSAVYNVQTILLSLQSLLGGKY